MHGVRVHPQLRHNPDLRVGTQFVGNGLAGVVSGVLKADFPPLKDFTDLPLGEFSLLVFREGTVFKLRWHTCTELVSTVWHKGRAKITA